MMNSLREISKQNKEIIEKLDTILDTLRSSDLLSSKPKTDDGDARKKRRIESLRLSDRIRHCLKRIDLELLDKEKRKNRSFPQRMETVQDILDYPVDSWKDVRNFGVKCAYELEECMHEMGYEEFKIPM